MTAIEEPPPGLAPGEKTEINKMADAFKSAVKGITSPPATPPAAPAKPAETPPEVPPPKPAASPPEKPPEPAKAPEKPAATEKKSPAREQFELLETEMRKYKSEVATLKPQFDATVAECDQLKAQLEEAKKGSAEYEQLKAQHDEKDKIIKQFYIENDPQFQRHYGEKISTAILEAKEAVGAEVAEKIEQVLQLPPSSYRDDQVEALAENIGDFRKAALVDAYTTLKRTERERKAQLQNATENHRKLKEVEAKQMREQAEKDAANRTALLQHVHAQIQPELEGTPPELAASIKESINKIASGSASTEEYVQFLIHGAKGQKFSSIVAEKDAKIATLEAQIQELTAAQPTLSGGSKAPPTKPGEPEDIGAKFHRYLNTGKK